MKIKLFLLISTLTLSYVTGFSQTETNTKKNNFEFSVGYTQSHLEMTHKYEKELQEKDTQGVFNLKNHQIKSLEGKIKEIENQINEANLKVNSSEKTVKEIALKAIENATKTQVIDRHRDKE